MSTFYDYGLTALELVAKLQLSFFRAIQVHEATGVEHEVLRQAFLEGLRTVQEFGGTAARKERLAHLHRDIIASIVLYMDPIAFGSRMTFRRGSPIFI